MKMMSVRFVGVGGGVFGLGFVLTSSSTSFSNVGGFSLLSSSSSGDNKDLVTEI